MKFHFNPKASTLEFCSNSDGCVLLESGAEHFATLLEAQQANRLMKQPSRGRRTVIYSSAILKRDITEFFKAIENAEISTEFKGGLFEFNLADLKGRTLESLMSNYFATRNLQVIKEPNGRDSFPDFLVKTRVGGWIPLELKEESLDSKSRGRTNKRIIRIGAAINSLARNDELFEAIFLTAGKTSSAASIIFQTIEFHHFLELVGPTKGQGGKAGKGIAFDVTTQNLMRGSGRFTSRREAVQAILHLYDEVCKDTWIDKAAKIESIKQKYSL